MKKACYKIAILAISLLSACAQSPNRTHPQDPYEDFNRQVFKINQRADKMVVRPTASFYENYFPKPIKLGLGNMLDNINDVTSMCNDILQGDIHYLMWDTSRVLINTTVGILGLFDPASALGLDARKQDFGQTLYHWGYHTSSYIILPLLGPSTIRDGIGVGVDSFILSPSDFLPLGERLGIILADLVDKRARLLRHQDVVEALSIGDEYTLIRSAYFQHREYLFKGATEGANDEKTTKSEEVDPYTGFDETPSTGKKSEKV